MNTRFRESFDQDLSALTDAGLRRRIRRVIEQVEAAQTFQQIPNLKRLDARGKYYRIRVGDYRIGFVFEQSAVTFVRCLNRKEIYRYFP
ncbi:MAG: type II toxin-antitoxin system RelE/ParE family toxin [Verrucomicrobia bacterium]|nr:type II toxin-antitoxin system RelE/ParE family toxin [Verrucomicrobiota bacterium]